MAVLKISVNHEEVAYYHDVESTVPDMPKEVWCDTNFSGGLVEALSGVTGPDFMLRFVECHMRGEAVSVPDALLNYVAWRARLSLDVSTLNETFEIEPGLIDGHSDMRVQWGSETKRVSWRKLSYRTKLDVVFAAKDGLLVWHLQDGVEPGPDPEKWLGEDADAIIRTDLPIAWIKALMKLCGHNEVVRSIIAPPPTVPESYSTIVNLSVRDMLMRSLSEACKVSLPSAEPYLWFKRDYD